MRNLVIRIISSVIAVSLLVGSIYFGKNVLLLMCLLCVCICFFEFSNFFPKSQRLSVNEQNLVKRGFIFFGIILFYLASQFPSQTIIIFPLTVLAWTGLLCWLLARTDNLSELLSQLNMMILGFVYCAILPAISVQIINQENGVSLFLWHLGIVFGGDIFAYFSGRLFGRHKLHEALSPKKTVEGAIGGLVGSVVFGYGIAVATGLSLHIAAMVALFLVTAVFAQLGDLFESFLKRFANLKDSGNIMPGHGGVLDRIDGVLFSSAVFLFAYNLLIKS